MRDLKPILNDNVNQGKGFMFIRLHVLNTQMFSASVILTLP